MESLHVSSSKNPFPKYAIAFVLGLRAVSTYADCSSPPIPETPIICEAVPKIDDSKSLFVNLASSTFASVQAIRDLPTGPWSAVYNLNQMAPAIARCGTTGSQIPTLDEKNCLPITQIRRDRFIRHFMKLWTDPTQVNGISVTARPDPLTVALIVGKTALWNDSNQLIAKTITGACAKDNQGRGNFSLDELADLNCANVGGNCTCSILDIAKAPFVPLDIIYRPDLAARSALTNGPINGGEGRFVYRLNTTKRNLFNVIFEYGLPLDAKNFPSAKSWATKWLDLQDASETTKPTYGIRLSQMTRSFSDAGRNAKGTNGSALLRLRSNEFVLAPSWELRQFKLDPTQGLFVREVDTENPSDSHRSDHTSGGPAAVFNTWAFQNQSGLCTGAMLIPDRITVDGTPQPLTGHTSRSQDLSNQPLTFQDAWLKDIAAANPNLQQKVNLKTCSGCHTLNDSGFANGNPMGSSFGFTHASGDGTFSEFVRRDLVRRENRLKCAISSACCSTPNVDRGVRDESDFLNHLSH